MARSQHFSPGDIQFQLVYGKGRPVTLILFGLGGRLLRVFAKYLRNGLTNLHETL